MRYLVFLSVLALVSVSVASAKWRPLDLAELEKNSDIIVIAELVLEKDQTKTQIGKKQVVQFKSIRDIKGEPGALFSVEGSAEHICKPQYFFVDNPGDKYLLFLRANDSGIYHVVNGQFGALIISSDTVNWFTDPLSYSGEREPQQLNDVLLQL